MVAKYCVPEYIIKDQVSAFMSSLMNYLFKKLDIKIKKQDLIIISCYKQNVELNPCQQF